MKPTEILELEKELGFVLDETKDLEDMYPYSPKSKVYLINSDNELIGLNLFNDGIECNLEEIVPALRNLRYCNLGSNCIQDIACFKYIKELQYLDLQMNKITDISMLGNLKKLKDLELSSNNIRNIDVLLNLKELQTLSLYLNNIEYISLAFILNFPNLKELYLYGNPIKNIPKEIIDLGEGEWEGNLTVSIKNVLTNVKNFLKGIEKGKSKNNDVKIILLGNGGVGKTQIAKRLTERDHFVFNAQHDSTHAIVLLQRELENLNLNIWDFAGQDMYHATHRLFMQTRALFVLVWDVESETSAYHEHAGKRYKNEKLQYWLEYARCFAPDSPILVVQNKVDKPDDTEQTYLEQTLEYYKAQYPIIEFVQVSAKTGYNVDVLEYWLAESFQQDENLKQQLLIDIPTSWANVRSDLRERQVQREKTLSVEDFKTLCATEAIPESWHTLLQYLHDTSVLYYREGYFGNQIILDQAWAIDAVYAVLNRQSFYFRTGKIKKGRLQYTDLQELWKNNTDDERKLFIDFMLSTELCFETTENKSYDTPLQERTFVVPQLLSEEKPKAVAFEETERNIRQMSEVVKYRFLPSVFIQRFIIKANTFSNVEMMWQHGILLQWKDFYAVVESDYDAKEILIHSNDGFLIQKIKEELELITDEGNVKAMKPTAGEDFIEKGERFLRGLAGLRGNPKIEAVRPLIAAGNLAEALQILFSKMPNEAALLQNRLSTLEQKERKGTISAENATLERNQIADAALQLGSSEL